MFCLLMSCCSLDSNYVIMHYGNLRDVTPPRHGIRYVPHDKLTAVLSGHPCDGSKARLISDNDVFDASFPFLVSLSRL